MREIRCEECDKRGTCPEGYSAIVTGCMVFDDEDFEEVKDL